MTSKQFKFPVVSLIVFTGVLGISYSNQQHQRLFPSNALAASYIKSNHQSQIKSDSAFGSGLQDIKRENIQLSQVNTFDQKSADKFTEDITTLSTNTRELGRKGKVQFPKQDGIYLYGQSSKPSQLGQGYVIFQKQQDKIIGALYVPQSEFSCFQGTLAKSGELAMTVKSSPGEVGAIEVSTNSRIPKFNDDNSQIYAHSMNLKDYHQLSSPSANDRKILEMCRNEGNGVR